MQKDRILCPGTSWRKTTHVWTQILFYTHQNKGTSKSFTGAQLMRELKSQNCERSTFYLNIKRMTDAGLFTAVEGNSDREVPLILSEIGKECAVCMFNCQVHNAEYACGLGIA